MNHLSVLVETAETEETLKTGDWRDCRDCRDCRDVRDEISTPPPSWSQISRPQKNLNLQIPTPFPTIVLACDHFTKAPYAVNKVRHSLSSLIYNATMSICEFRTCLPLWMNWLTGYRFASSGFMFCVGPIMGLFYHLNMSRARRVGGLARLTINWNAL